MTRVFQKLVKLAAALALVSAAQAAHAEAPPYVRFRSITWNGTGCPLGTTAANLSPDRTAFTLIFNSYIAEVGPRVSLREKRKYCQVNLDLEFPNGWSYTILDVDYRGYASIDPGVKGELESVYYFQGDLREARLARTVLGTFDDDYHVRDTLGIDAVVWSPCSATRALNIKTAVALDAGFSRNGRGLMTVDSIDGALTHIYGLRWRRC
jgi:hypothetical protein